MEKKLLEEVNLNLLAARNNGVVPDIPPRKAAKELKRFIKSPNGEKLRLTLELSGNYCFIGTRPVTDDVSKLRVYYLGPGGLRKTPPIDVQTFKNEVFRPDFLNDKRVKRKHTVDAFMRSVDGGHQARDLVPTLKRRLRFITARQINSNRPIDVPLRDQLAA